MNSKKELKEFIQEVVRDVLNEAKMSNERVADWIEKDGLDYAATSGFSPRDVEDKKLAGMLTKYRKLHDEIFKYLNID